MPTVGDSRCRKRRKKLSRQNVAVAKLSPHAVSFYSESGSSCPCHLRYIDHILTDIFPIELQPG